MHDVGACLRNHQPAGNVFRRCLGQEVCPAAAVDGALVVCRPVGQFGTVVCLIWIVSPVPTLVKVGATASTVSVTDASFIAWDGAGEVVPSVISTTTGW